MACQLAPENMTDGYFAGRTVKELTTPRAVLPGGGAPPPTEEKEGSDAGTDEAEENLPVDRETIEEDSGPTIVS